MNKTSAGALMASLVLIAAGTPSAHHNMSADFDLNNRFTVTGTLAKIDWRNPHIEMLVDVTGDQSHVETWRFEGPSPSAFRNWNIARGNFESAIGKSTTVEASRARDGSRWGLLRVITLSDGKVVSLCPAYC